jgi:two-component system, LytTR family, response regulator
MENPLKLYIFVKRKAAYQRILISDIIYLEASGDYVLGYLVDDQFVVRSTLARMEALLPQPHFMRIHRSYIIQLEKMDTINFLDGSVGINGKILPINRESRKKITLIITKLD